MRLFFYLLINFVYLTGTVKAQPETPQQSLNHYVAFINQSVDVLTGRFRMLQAYQADVEQYRKKPDGLRLPCSGPLEAYYYNKALASTGLTAAEKQQLTASTQALWQLLNRIDQTGKSLETYVRLNEYERDNLNQSDARISDMQVLFGQFSRDKDALFSQIQRLYRRYQPYKPADPYLYTENDMQLVLTNQRQLLDSLRYYLTENSRADWPVTLVQLSMLADEKLLAQFGKGQSVLAYPASDMLNSFRAAIRSLQAVKQRAIDDNTFAAQQSVHHGNAVYLSLLNSYNQDLLAAHQLFVNYSRPARQLLHSVKFSPVFTIAPPASGVEPVTQTVSFSDKPPVPLTLRRAAVPVSKPTFAALNGYVAFINESLRQMHQLQVLLRNYEASAASYGEPDRSGRRAALTYSHEGVKMPVSAYQLLINNSQQLLPAYRTSLNTQAEVLINMLTEMDGLSIELTAYTNRKQYEQDRLAYSNAVLDRYAYLFALFDQKKEQLYRDVRRVFESYPAASPNSAWAVAGNAMLQTLDHNTDVLFGVKAFLNVETARLPGTDKLETTARTLIADEYKNLKGLPRLGRNDGRCPYTPYEDLAENSLRFAEKTRKVKPLLATTTTHPYESLYFFYNNELVAEYNRFTELANVPLLLAVNQPDVFLLRRSAASGALPLPPRDPAPPANELTAKPKPVTNVPERANQSTRQRDTVYVERTRTDTVYVDRGLGREVPNTLNGFALNNMVLLLDVSGSMDAPVKLPLLKRSIKALLTLLRPDDQLSVVIYSGRAKVALKPTSGANTAGITRVIDALESSGDTDGNGGIKLAYKVANKSYIRAGNNRIILATDGEFPVSDEVFELIAESARQDIYLTVFTFGRNALTGQNLKKLSQLGGGSFTHVTSENASGQLILEAQAKKAPGR